MNWINVDYEDLETPVFLLQKGVEKLLKYGMPTFLNYAKEAGLSFCDINRVISKVRMAHKVEIKEIPCPTELYSKRWDYYTKVFGYSDSVAREKIKAIDSMFTNERRFPDVKRLVRGIGG